MRANDILSDQVIVVKRGRQNDFGFEPLWNAYFDFYLDSRYFEKPLLELEDVTFHLYLRKNLNDKDKSWQMPTIRQIMKKFRIGQNKVYGMLDRLEKAHLLNKESGARVGVANERNDYILSDPISTLTEFLEVAAEGLFRYPLLPRYAPLVSEMDTPSIQNEYTPVSEMDTPSIQNEYTAVSISDTSPCIQNGYDQHTSFSFKHTFNKQVDPAFQDLRFLVGEKIFDTFMDGAKLISIHEGVAIIGIINAYAKDWIENRMADKIMRSLNVDGLRCVVLTE